MRSAAVPVPAGLGVQDVGYVLCLRALGVPDATTVATAFVVLKRGKDLFWILLGFALMALGERKASGPVASGRDTLLPLRAPDEHLEPPKARSPDASRS